MATSLTLQTATAATFDTGWRQAPGNAWTDSSLVLTLTGAGAVLLTLLSRDDDSTNTIYRQEVSWSASGSQTITLPTPFFGQLRLTGEVKAAGGTIAVAISGDFGPSPVIGPSGEAIFGGAIAPGVLSAVTDIAAMGANSIVCAPSGGLIYNHPTGQKIFDGNKLFNAYVADGSAFTSTSEATVITPASIASQYNIDGKYNRQSKHKIPPVIRAGFISAKENWLHSHFELGGNFSTTPSGKTLTIREYWLKPDDTAVKILEIVIDGANLASWTSGSNRPIHVYADYNIDNIVSPTSQKIRVHWHVRVGAIGSGLQLWDARESFFGDYPIVDLSVEQRIKWTAQWNVSGGTLYSDNLEYWI